MALPRLHGSRRALRRHVEAAAEAAVRPARGDRFLRVGNRPLRLLLIGSGLAVGYGVETRSLALDGRVGAALADALDRGVIVNNQAAHGQRLEDQIRSAVASEGFGLEDLVIWCPSYVEMTERAGPGAWHRRLRALLEVTPASKPLIVVELPVPVGTDRVAAPASALIERINAALRRAAASRPNVHVVSPPPVLVRPLGQPLFDADYYAEAGASVAALALGLLTGAEQARPGLGSVAAPA